MTDMTTDDVHESVVPALPSVTLTPLAITGQPATDKGFVTENGTKIRVRVVLVDQQTTRAPVNGDPKIAASGYVFSISCAKLNDDLTVATDERGALLIMDRHEIVMGDAAMANAAFDPEAELMTTIEQDAYRLEQRAAKRAAAADYFGSQWGMVAPAATAEEPVLPLEPLAEPSAA